MPTNNVSEAMVAIDAQIAEASTSVPLRLSSKQDSQTKIVTIYKGYNSNRRAADTDSTWKIERVTRQNGEDIITFPNGSIGASFSWTQRESYNYSAAQ